jgi:transcriptional regulator with XRE-family HTH domain
MKFQVVDKAVFARAFAGQGLTQERLAQLVGVPQSEVSRIRCGLVPTPKMQAKIARALGETVSAVFPTVTHEALIRAAA